MVGALPRFSWAILTQILLRANVGALWLAILIVWESECECVVSPLRYLPNSLALD